MAASSASPLILTLASLLLTFPSVISATCNSQRFSNERNYSLCSDLPTLNASLHWTHSASNSSLSIAFIAPLLSSIGWVSWGINPTAKAMIGSQALLAYRLSNGSVAVDTYNISSFENIVPSPIAFRVSNKEAHYSDGAITIFATLSLPNGGPTTVNHVWQVGPGMMGTSPLKHAMALENLNAKGSLDFLKTNSSTGTANTTGGPGNSTSNSTPSSAVAALFSSPFFTSAALLSVLVAVA